MMVTRDDLNAVKACAMVLNSEWAILLILRGGSKEGEFSKLLVSMLDSICSIHTLLVSVQLLVVITKIFKV